MQNLVQANERRAILIAMICASRLDAAGIDTAWKHYHPSEGLIGELRADTLIQYMRPKSVDDGENYTRIFFDTPRLTDVETVDFGEETPIHKDVIERFTEPIEKIKGIGYEDTIQHTFSKTTSLQEAFKVGAELAVKTYFKGSYAGIEGGAEVSAKLTAEYSRQWGNTETQSDTVTRHISLPEDFEGKVNYEAVRSVDKVQRKITADSNLDYKIEFVSGPKPEPVHWIWEGLDEFLQVIQGRASTTHAGYYQFTSPHTFRDVQILDDLVTSGKQSVEFLVDYDNVQSQEIRIVKGD